MDAAAVFSEHRSLLQGMAYRMLGSVAQAEDMVQETYLRWQAQTDVKNPRAWLTTALTRLCIDHLRSAQRQREEYYGVWLPEPLVESADSPAQMTELADSLSLAFLHLLECLGPVERAVFLLREAFGYDYAEISRMVDKSEASCRQMVSRAKAQLAGRSEAPAGSSEEAERIVTEFLTACETGDLQDFLSILSDDAVMYSDGGGKVKAIFRPIRSALYIARFLMGVRRFLAVGAKHRVVRVNGQTGVITRRADGVLVVSTFTVRDGRIAGVYMVSNPDKLQKLAHLLPE